MSPARSRVDNGNRLCQRGGIHRDRSPLVPSAAALFMVTAIFLTGCTGDGSGDQEVTIVPAKTSLSAITTLATTASSAPSPPSDTTGGAAGSTPPPASVWVLATSEKTLAQLAKEVERGLEGTGVPVYSVSKLPSGYTVAEIVRSLSGPRENPVFWENSGPRPDPGAAGYRVFFTNGTTWVRLDVNPQADHGNVQWKGTGVRWNGRELSYVEYPDAYWVRVPVPEDMRVEVWGPPEAREDVLWLASHVTRVGEAEGR